MPLAPKVLSRALSSNSPTMRGRIPCCKNQWSIRSRTTLCLVGSSTGTSARLCGKLRLATCKHAGVPYQAMAEAPTARLYSLICGLAGAGRSESTTSSRCKARSPNKPSNWPSWHTKRKCGSARTGCSRRRTTSLGRPSEMPTAKRTAGALAASRTKAGRFSPKWKIKSAWCMAACPASVSTRPRPDGFNSAQPSERSSSRTWALTVCTAMSNFSAARETPPSLATTQK